MSYREYFATQLDEINFITLVDDIVDAGVPIEDIEGVSPDFDNDRVGIDFPDGQPPSAGQIVTIQAAVDAHDPVDYEAVFNAGAKSDIRAQIKPLVKLAPRQAFLVATIRQIRDAYGDSDTINTIGQGVAYNDGLADFQEFSTGQQRYIKRLMSSLVNAMLTSFD